MKIGVDCRLINTTQNTGISRYTEFLIEYYVNHFDAENVILISNDKNFYYKGLTIVYTKLKPFNLIHFLSYSKFIANITIDLLHVPFYSAFFRKGSTLVIVTVHDLMYKFIDGFFGKNKIINFFKIIYFDFIVKNSLVSANKIVSVSETTQRDIFSLFNCNSLHIPEDSEIKASEDFSVLDKYNLKEKNFYFYCGNNRPHKNLNFIIEIFKNNHNLPPLVLSGKGHSNFDNVIATGVVTDSELKSLYIAASAFVFPSKYEGFGLPILESLRFETFVIASKISAFQEFKTSNIFFFELDNKKEFLKAIEKTCCNNFVIDNYFLEQYDKKKIYDLTDQMISDLLMTK
jgi:glycosyltransferase involved in cell wall biosynthesis